MLRSFITHVILFGIAAVAAVILVAYFDDYYQDLETRRRTKWEARNCRRDHPSNSGPRYE